jgi:hypothetical protein
MVMSWQNLDRQRRSKRMVSSCGSRPRPSLPGRSNDELVLGKQVDFINNNLRHEALFNYRR